MKSMEKGKFRILYQGNLSDIISFNQTCMKLYLIVLNKRTAYSLMILIWISVLIFELNFPFIFPVALCYLSLLETLEKRKMLVLRAMALAKFNIVSGFCSLSVPGFS